MNSFNFQLTNILIGVTELIITTVLLFLAFHQLKKLNSFNDATFIQSITSNFYKNETIILITLLYADCILFDNNNAHPIFRINKIKTADIYPNLSYPEKGYYSADEIDILLLNNLDDVGLFVEKKLISLVDAYHTFGYYINATLNNSAIVAYFEWIKNPFVFSKLKKLHGKFSLL